jgi:hypothetical protein
LRVSSADLRASAAARASNGSRVDFKMMMECATLELHELDIAALQWPEHDPALAAKHGGRYRTRPEEQLLLRGPVLRLVLGGVDAQGCALRDRVDWRGEKLDSSRHLRLRLASCSASAQQQEHSGAMVGGVFP